MRVLILDVDGVLVHHGSVSGGRASGEPSTSSFFHAATVDPACAKRLKRIVDATGARIALSSTWRRFEHQKTGLKRALIDAGFDRRELRGLFLPSTPYFGSEGLARAKATGKSERVIEVEAWLAEHPEVTRYLAIDDHPLPGHPQLDPRPDYFSGGLLDAHADQAIRLLTGDP